MPEMLQTKLLNINITRKFRTVEKPIQIYYDLVYFTTLLLYNLECLQDTNTLVFIDVTSSLRLYIARK